MVLWSNFKQKKQQQQQVQLVTQPIQLKHHQTEQNRKENNLSMQNNEQSLRISSKVRTFCLFLCFYADF